MRLLIGVACGVLLGLLVATIELNEPTRRRGIYVRGEKNPDFARAAVLQAERIVLAARRTV